MRESLGMRIGGGLGSNEGDTPIYIANINPQGPVGRRRTVKVRDVVNTNNRLDVKMRPPGLFCIAFYSNRARTFFLDNNIV